MQASEGSKRMDRAISKMNGRDCGGLGWGGSVDAVMIGSRVHEAKIFGSSVQKKGF
jgi:hypothetical protein